MSVADRLREISRLEDHGEAIARAALLVGEHGGELDLSEENFNGLNLSGMVLDGARLNRAQLASTDLSGAKLRGVSIVCPVMERTKLVGADMVGLYGHALSIVSSDASRVDMGGAVDVTGSLFHGVRLVGARLVHGNFAGATFYQCDLTDADLSYTDLQGVTFNECVMRRADLTGARLADATFTRCQADGLKLPEARGRGVTFQSMLGFRGVLADGALLPDATFRATAIKQGRFKGACLARASFTDCAVGGTVFVAADMAGARLYSCHGKTDFGQADLTDTLLVGCVLNGSVFLGVLAENAQWTRCSVRDGVFQGFRGRGFSCRDSDLSGADFRGAYLYRAFFTGDPVHAMMLDRAVFTDANLIQATLAASLRGADMRGVYGAYSRLNQSDFTDADLRGFGMYGASTLKMVTDGAKVSEQQEGRGST